MNKEKLLLAAGIITILGGGYVLNPSEEAYNPNQYPLGEQLAIVDVTHPSYNAIVQQQKDTFDLIVGATNYVPILSDAGTEAIIELQVDINSPAIIQKGGQEVKDNWKNNYWNVTGSGS